MMERRPGLKERILGRCWSRWPDTTAFLLAFFRNMVGIILPTLSCAVLLQAAMLESVPDYFAEDFYDASFSFGTSSLLLIELMRPSGRRAGRVEVDVHRDWKLKDGRDDSTGDRVSFFGSRGFGVLLLGVLLLISSGLAVNQVLVNQYQFSVRAEFAPWINFVFAVGVSCYLARLSVTSPEGRECTESMAQWAEELAASERDVEDGVMR